jgi:hypothetical protein
VGTRMFDLRSQIGAINLNTLSAFLDDIDLTMAPDVVLRYDFFFQDASKSNGMSAELDASVIAFDPSEMTRNDSPLWPQATVIGGIVSAPQIVNGALHADPPGPISCFLEALESLSFMYSGGTANGIWAVHAWPYDFGLTGVPYDASHVLYRMFLGTMFGNRLNTAPFSFQISTATGMMK